MAAGLCLEHIFLTSDAEPSKMLKYTIILFRLKTKNRIKIKHFSELKLTEHSAVH